MPVIIQDTREQNPYSFEGYQVEQRGLKTGDYSLDGHEGMVCIERKSLSDAYGVVGGGRERFRRELERLAKIQSPTVIIEANLDAMEMSRSSLTVAQVVGSFVSWAEEYRIPTWTVPNHAYGERLALLWLKAYWRHYCRTT
jgi:ERCC4-type nuclease